MHLTLVATHVPLLDVQLHAKKKVQSGLESVGCLRRQPRAQVESDARVPGQHLPPWNIEGGGAKEAKLGDQSTSENFIDWQGQT